MCLDPGVEIIGRSTYTDNFSKYLASLKKKASNVGLFVPIVHAETEAQRR